MSRTTGTNGSSSSNRNTTEPDMALVAARTQDLLSHKDAQKTFGLLMRNPRRREVVESSVQYERERE